MRNHKTTDRAGKGLDAGSILQRLADKKKIAGREIIDPANSILLFASSLRRLRKWLGEKDGNKYRLREKGYGFGDKQGKLCGFHPFYTGIGLMEYDPISVTGLIHNILEAFENRDYRAFKELAYILEHTPPNEEIPSDTEPELAGLFVAEVKNAALPEREHTEAELYEIIEGAGFQPRSSKTVGRRAKAFGWKTMKKGFPNPTKKQVGP